VNITLSYDQIRSILDRLGESDYGFRAVAGPEFGTVQAWILDSNYLVAVSFDNKVNYLIVEKFDNPTDLIYLLIRNDKKDPIDRIINLANVRGIKMIDAATGKETGPYVILRTRYFKKGFREVTSVVCNDTGEIYKFASFEEAQSFANAQERLQTSSEYARPRYTIVSIGDKEDV